MTCRKRHHRPRAAALPAQLDPSPAGPLLMRLREAAQLQADLSNALAERTSGIARQGVSGRDLLELTDELAELVEDRQHAPETVTEADVRRLLAGPTDTERYARLRGLLAENGSATPLTAALAQLLCSKEGAASGTIE